MKGSITHDGMKGWCNDAALHIIVESRSGATV